MVNKEADWPIAEKDKVRQESQTEKAGRKKGGVGSGQPHTEEAGCVQSEITSLEPCVII